MLMFLFLVRPANLWAQSTGEPAAQEETAATPPLVPKLQVNIPTINFTEVAARGNLLSLPFLADYITGLYKYLLTIVGVLAGIMLTIGGVKYLTSSGSQERVTSAKNTITNALIGLIIAFGSYVILFTVNPELVRFKALSIERVNPVELVFNEMLTTTVDTRIPGGETTPPQEAAPTTSFANCPVSLSVAPTQNSPREPRTQEFLQKISSVITGSTVRERVLQIAEAAAKCGVHMGACGKTGETINGAAGVSGLGRQLRTGSLNLEQANWLITLNCRANLLNKPACRNRPSIEIPNCPANTKCVVAARAMAAAKFRTEIPGWPDSFANQLQPGDAFWVYYAIPEPGGQHTAIFMGWEGNFAKVVQGAIGKLVNEGKICIKSESGCGGRFYPITRIFKPE